VRQEHRPVHGINAGLDMIMVPNQYVTFENDLTSLVNSGDIPTSRIDDAVRRILTEKFALGLFEHPFADRSNIDAIGSPAHRAVARQAAAESQVLLKNAHNVLPLSRSAKIYVAGSNADDTGNQSGGWTLTWQGQSGTIPGATSILAGMRQDAPGATITYSQDASAPTDGYKLGVVVVGEKPYAEGQGDIGNNGHTLQLSVADRNAVDTVCAAMKCAVLVVSGRPLDITGIVPEADAVVASWLPGSEGEGVADVLFGLQPFTGRLPVTWFKAESQIPINVGDKNYDPLFPYGWGLQTGSQKGQVGNAQASGEWNCCAGAELGAGREQLVRRSGAASGRGARRCPASGGRNVAADKLGHARSTGVDRTRPRRAGDHHAGADERDSCAHRERRARPRRRQHAFGRATARPGTIARHGDSGIAGERVSGGRPAGRPPRTSRSASRATLVQHVQGPLDSRLSRLGTLGLVDPTSEFFPVCRRKRFERRLGLCVTGERLGQRGRHAHRPRARVQCDDDVDGLTDLYAQLRTKFLAEPE
jgi:glycosyl hydrolase family 3